MASVTLRGDSRIKNSSGRYRKAQCYAHKIDFQPASEVAAGGNVAPLSRWPRSPLSSVGSEDGQGGQCGYDLPQKAS